MDKKYIIIGAVGIGLLYLYYRSRSAGAMYNVPQQYDPGFMIPIGDTTSKKESEISPSVIVYDIDFTAPEIPPINIDLLDPNKFFNGGQEVSTKTPTKTTYGLGYAQIQPKVTTKKEAQAIVTEAVSKKIPGPIGQEILKGWLK